MDMSVHMHMIRFTGKKPLPPNAPPRRVLHTVSFDIGTKDFESLAGALRDQSISNEDVKSLQAALEAEPSRPTTETYGPKVTAWLSEMVGKAASGAWNIGVGAAGAVLAEMLAKYYGVK